ncbi:MAG: LuxE/PaaK family acyltransferase, partial [Candidatus Binataceae bacterium]
NGAREFLTSGTTIGVERRGRHVVARPEVYRASAIAQLGSMLFPDGARMRILALHPTAERMPESSLSAMVTWCIEEFGSGESRCVADRGRVDTESARAFLREATAGREPVCLLGTTAAFAALFERMAESHERLKLATGSRMMDTGGPKGQRVPLPAAEVASVAGEILGIEADLVINEYGMTELCSQLYDATPLNSRYRGAPGARVKLAPPWMRPMAIDPASMRRVPDGRPGMLAFIDLANVCSVSAVITEDLGIVEGGCVRVIGRPTGAGARGCALSIESFQAAVLRT